MIQQQQHAGPWSTVGTPLNLKYNNNQKLVLHYTYSSGLIIHNSPLWYHTNRKKIDQNCTKTEEIEQLTLMPIMMVIVHIIHNIIIVSTKNRESMDILQ